MVQSSKIKYLSIPKKNHFNSTKKIRFVIIYGELNTGGIETLIVRLSNYLLSANYKISVHLSSGGTLINAFNSGVKVFLYANLPELICNVKNSYGSTDTDLRTILLSFDPNSAARSELVALSQIWKSDITHITGVFHPKAYFMDTEPLDRVVLNKWLGRSIGPGNMFFMNEECRIAHAEYWGCDLLKSSIIQLPVDLKEPLWRPRTYSSIRIVSVGRLVDFKAYNLGAPYIIRECLDLGYEVTWDIYGTGPLEGAMIKISEELGVASKFKLKGELDYKKFAITVAKYDLFVGMGTAALEAAMSGIPTICATVNEVDRSHGYLSQLPFGNVGELIKNRSPRKIIDIIREYSELSTASRLALSEREINSSRKYTTSAFIDALYEKIKFFRSPQNRFHRYFIARTFYELTEGLIAKKLLGKGLKRAFYRLIGR